MGNYVIPAHASIHTATEIIHGSYVYTYNVEKYVYMKYIKQNEIKIEILDQAGIERRGEPVSEVKNLFVGRVTWYITRLSLRM